jgi:chromate transporter
VVMVQLGSRVLKGIADYVIVLATAAAVALFGVQVPYALIAAGIVAIWWHRPREGKAHDKTPHAAQIGERHHE